MDIQSAIRVDDVPPPTKYDEIHSAALGLEPGQALPIEFETHEECRKVYEALWHWKIRKRHDDLVLRKRGTTLYVERT